MNFYLYRLKAFRHKEHRPTVGRMEFFESLIARKPSAELRTGYKWHIGNVEEIDEGFIHFAVGRTTKQNSEKFDEETGDFQQKNDSESPFTHILVDKENSVVAIAAKSKLSPTTKGIARSLERLLNEQTYTTINKVRFELNEIVDPDQFLKTLRSAYEVVGFTMNFTEPNPFDVEEDFHKPMERLLEQTGGKKGFTKIQGNNLDKDVLEDLARSVAATGDHAAARIRREQGQRPTSTSINGEPICISVSKLSKAALIELGRKIRKVYESVRG